MITQPDIVAAKRATLVLKSAIDTLKDPQAKATCADDMRALIKVIRFVEAKVGE